MLSDGGAPVRDGHGHPGGAAAAVYAGDDRAWGSGLEPVGIAGEPPSVGQASAPGQGVCTVALASGGKGPILPGGAGKKALFKSPEMEYNEKKEMRAQGPRERRERI